MAGGNIAAGLSLILAALVITLIVAFIQTEGAQAEGELPGCSATACNDISITDFLLAIVDVSITGIQGAPTIVNALYLLTVGGAYIAGVILLVAGAASVPFGGG